MRISDWSSDVCSSDLRFSVNVRLPQDYRNSIDRIKRIPIQTASMGTIPLSAVADIAFVNGPPMISSDNAMLRGAVLFNVRDRDLGRTVQAAKIGRATCRERVCQYV